MPLLFGRAAAVTIANPDGTGVDRDARRFTGLRVRFHVASTLRPEPNPGEIIITNLAATTRAQIQLNEESRQQAVPTPTASSACSGMA